MQEGFMGGIQDRLMKSLEAKRPPGKRILFIGDREPRNFEEFLDYSNNHPGQVQPAGLIVPGGELDKDIGTSVRLLRDIRHGDTTPIDEGNGALGYQFLTPTGDDFRYEHAPYETARLGDTDYRREYCSELARMAERAEADWIFLSNFKIFLDPVFVKAFEGRIINVHPSVLPLLKGFRPEFRADKGEEPQASGYTIHLVDTDLDGGPTIFQQHVPLKPRNPEEDKKSERKEYDDKQEESNRTKFINAQARWTPLVLALVSSDVPRKIVSGDEAFAVEDRPDFAQSEAYQHSLQSEYEAWKIKNENSTITFEEWKKVQKPYSRVLFDNGNGWQTAEKILGAPQESNEPNPDVVTNYMFTIHGDKKTARQRYMRLFQLAEEIRERRGRSGVFKQKYDGRSYPPTASIMLPYSAKEEFEELIAREGIDVTLDIETNPTRVKARRKKFWPGNED